MQERTHDTFADERRRAAWPAFPRGAWERGTLSRSYVALLLVAMTAFGLFQALCLPTNCDVAWYLYAGARLLDGAQLGHDVVEINPPLIIVFSMGVEALARGLGCSALTLMPWLMTALIVSSLAVCARLAADWPPLVRRWFLVGLAYVLLIHVGGMWGQREHLLLVLVMPYACSIVQLTRGQPIATSLSVMTGVMAALGFALKPFFMPAWIAIEVYAAFRCGPASIRRPQALAIMASLAGFGLTVFLATSDYLAFIVESISLYRAYQPYGELPIVLSGSFAFVLIAVALAGRSARRLAPVLTDVTSVLAVMLSLAVFLQGKGWHYQWYPAVSLGIVLLLISVASMADRTRAITRLGAQGIVGLAIVLLLLRSYLFWRAVSPAHHELATVIQEHARGKPILALSSDVHVGFPLVNEIGVRWASRYPTMWQLPALCARAIAEDGIGPQEARFLDAVFADLTSARPAVLIVDSVPPTPSLAGFDYLEYFRRDPRLARALDNYHFLKRTGRYQIFIRADLR